MRRLCALLALAMGLTLTLTLTQAPLVAQAGVRAAHHHPAAPKAHHRKKFRPHNGVRFNRPLSPRDRGNIRNYLIEAINRTPQGSKIRIASWNLRSNDITRALVRAKRRGVSVRLIMDAGNADAANPNDNFTWLHTVLPKGNKHRKPSMRSWAQRCKGSCRGPGGISHTKMYLFTHTGTGRNVVMYGSANATDLAAGYQWNDLYTLVERPELYQHLIGVFDQMRKDRALKNAYETWTSGKHFRQFVYPYRGKDTPGDPVMRILDKITCSGAIGGIGGHTKIRILQTAILGQRGIDIASKLRAMHDNGCNIRIVYAVMGNRVLDILRAGNGVEIRQIAQDWNQDGIYDRYLHMKAMSVQGNFAGKRDATITWNGSANWSPLALSSDEVDGRVKSPAVAKRYADWCDTLYFNPPPGPRYTTPFRSFATGRTFGGRPNPYAKMQVD